MREISRIWSLGYFFPELWFSLLFLFLSLRNTVILVTDTRSLFALTAESFEAKFVTCL